MCEVLCSLLQSNPIICSLLSLGSGLNTQYYDLDIIIRFSKIPFDDFIRNLKSCCCNISPDSSWLIPLLVDMFRYQRTLHLVTTFESFYLFQWELRPVSSIPIHCCRFSRCFVWLINKDFAFLYHLIYISRTQCAYHLSTISAPGHSDSFSTLSLRISLSNGMKSST